jgi:TonB family protein
MINRLLTYIFLIIFVQNIFAQQRVVSGLIIDKKTTWSGTVIVEGDVTVAKKGRLIIEAGSRILFKPHLDKMQSGEDKTRSELIVFGIIIVKGQLENKVIFSSAAKKPRLGDWYGLRLMNPKKISVIDYCVVEYAFNGISIKKSNPVIRNSQITLNYNAGILVEVKAEPKISKNIISENGYAGVITSLGAKPILADNLIAANQIGLIALSLSQPNLGNLNNSKKVNQGRNNIFENSEYDIYNHTNLPLMAENNSWGDNNITASIASRLYDETDDSKYGTIDFLPIYKKANLDEFLQISQLSANTEQLPISEIDQSGQNSVVEQPAEQEAQTQDTPPPAIETTPVQREISSLASNQKSEEAKLNATGEVGTINTEPVQKKVSEPSKPKLNLDQIFLEYFTEAQKGEIVKKVAPQITKRQLGRGEKGQIIVRVVVAKNGSVESASVIKGLNPYFDKISEAAALRFKYKPGIIKGQPVRFYSNIFFEF